MTGPGRSPSSSWVQSEQGQNLDGKGMQSFRPGVSPSNAGMQTSNSFFEQSGPNYFGITVENSHDSPNSNFGPHAQQNWGSLQRAQSSLPSPNLQLYSQESVSEGLANLLKTESELDKERRQTAFQGGSFNGGLPAIKRNGHKSISVHEPPAGHGVGTEKPRGSFSQGS